MTATCLAVHGHCGDGDGEQEGAEDGGVRQPEVGVRRSPPERLQSPIRKAHAVRRVPAVCMACVRMVNHTTSGKLLSGQRRLGITF